MIKVLLVKIFNKFILRKREVKEGSEFIVPGLDYEIMGKYAGMVKLLRPSMQEKTCEMFRFARSNGWKMIIESGYRSKRIQQQIYEDWKAGVFKAPVVLKPGTSKHEYGCAIDITLSHQGDSAYSKMGDFAKIIGLTWGGDWEKNPERWHFELDPKKVSRGYIKNKYGIKNLGHFAKIIGVELPKSADKTIPFKRVIAQSSCVKPGDFVIDPGWYGSYNFINESIKRGAAAIFCSAKLKEMFPQEFVYSINDTKEAIYNFEKYMVNLFDVKKITITGSVGKTTATALINSVVDSSFYALTRKSGLNLNSYGSILRHVQMLKSKHKYWVQEVCGCQPGYVELSAKFLRPDIVVLTNIQDSHLEYYKTRENVFYDKSSLERYAEKNGTVIINYDDDILRNGKYTHKLITCSIKDPAADYYAKDIVMKKDGIYFTAVCPKNREVDVHLNLYGEFNAYNALYAIAVGELIGLDLNKIPHMLEKYYPSGMRQNHILLGGYSIYADTHNANPQTMLETAKILEKIPLKSNGRKIFVSGQMNELGENSAQMHKDLGKELAKLDIDIVLTFAEQAKHTYEGLKESGFKNAIYFETREELDNWIRNNLTRNDDIFFKSSHGDICLAISIENIFGIPITNGMDDNDGYLVEESSYKYRVRKYGVIEIAGYKGEDKNLVIPDNYQDNVPTRIGAFAFRESSLETIVIPDTVRTICQEAFYRCKNLKSVKLSKSLLFVDKHAFNSCVSLEEIEIPENVIHIDYHAFYDCKSLKKAIIYEKVGFIEEEAFKNVSDEFEIVCKKGSYAEQYAKDNGIKVSYIV